MEEKIAYGEDSSMNQEITIAKDEISDFKIEKQESKVKGTEESIYCSCILNKKNVALGIQTEFHYSYKEQWEFDNVDIVVEVKSFDILGCWEGEYTGAGEDGKVTLNITKVEVDEIKANYSYVPRAYAQSGGYNISGKIDTKTLWLYDQNWFKHKRLCSAYQFCL